MPDRTGTLTAGRDQRRHDLDWLRVIAFGLLIFYHIGMFYVTWNWHIKSPHASHLIEPLMGLVNPWRLGLLFFISGVAMRFASDKERSWRFGGQRILRLLPPIVFGMLVVVPPQTYFELRFKWGIPPDFWSFYRLYLDHGYPMMTPTWNHLWYVVYILVYTLLLLPVLPRLRRLAERSDFGRLDGWRLLAVPVLPFLVFEATLASRFPTTHALVNDWAAHANDLTILLFGYFAAKDIRFWQAVDKAFPAALALAALIVLSSTAVKLGGEAVMAETGVKTALATARTVYAWSVIVALLGLAQRFLNRPSPVLSYLTKAVFPYYILHQTIIIAVGYPLIGSGLSAWGEALVVTAATVLGCVLVHEFVIRRSVLLRPLFGLKIAART